MIADQLSNYALPKQGSVNWLRVANLVRLSGRVHDCRMESGFEVETRTGAILLPGGRALPAGVSKMEIASRIANWQSDSRDFGNGYEWLTLRELSFGGHSAALSLCLNHGVFEEARWGVRLPGMPTEGGWPTREAIEQEITFVRSILARQIGLDPSAGEKSFPWGVVWSDFDPKGFCASNGLRYRPSPA